jgi:hypothetical protein
VVEMWLVNTDPETRVGVDNDDTAGIKHPRSVERRLFEVIRVFACLEGGALGAAAPCAERVLVGGRLRGVRLKTVTGQLLELLDFNESESVPSVIQVVEAAGVWDPGGPPGPPPAPRRPARGPGVLGVLSQGLRWKQQVLQRQDAEVKSLFGTSGPKGKTGQT